MKIHRRKSTFLDLKQTHLFYVALGWTYGIHEFLFFFQTMVRAQWFVNMTKTTTWVLWINVNSGFFIFVYWNQYVFWGIENFWRPLYRPRTTGNRPFLFHMWPVVGLKFPISYGKRTGVLNMTIMPTGLKIFGFVIPKELADGCPAIFLLVSHRLYNVICESCTSQIDTCCQCHFLLSVPLVWQRQR